MVARSAFIILTGVAFRRFSDAKSPIASALYIMKSSALMADYWEAPIYCSHCFSISRPVIWRKPGSSVPSSNVPGRFFR